MPGLLERRIEQGVSASDLTGALKTALHPPPPGASKSTPLNLLKHRALVARLVVEGAKPGDTASCAVLNLQLVCASETLRDYYIDLNFIGEKTIIVPEPSTERMLPEFRPLESNYHFKSAVQTFDYGRVTALNLRWMRVPKDAKLACALEWVEALAETDTVLSNPRLTVGDATLSFVADLRPGDYLEYLDKSPASVFDSNGFLLGTATADGSGQKLQPGGNTVMLQSDGEAAAKLVLITTGKPLAW